MSFRLWLITVVFLISLPLVAINAYGSDTPSNSNGGDGAADCNNTDADFYVATNGKDTWSGTLDAPGNNNTDGPFATLDRARRAVQGMPGGKHVVMVRGGNYFLSSPLTFSDDDSGTASTPIEYVNYGCEIPIISGGKKLTGWKNVSGNVWTVQLASTSYQNFEALFYKGERRFRPRSTFKSYLRNAGPVFVSNQSANCAVEVNGQWECFEMF